MQIDPETAITVAAATSGFLLPLLKKAGEKTLEAVAGKLPDTAAKIWEVVVDKVKGNVVAHEATKQVVQQPDNKLKVDAFVNQLAQAIAEDPAFAEKLQTLLKEANVPQSVVTIKNTGSGAVATHGGVAAGEGGVAVKGDVKGDINIGAPPKKKKK